MGLIPQSVNDKWAADYLPGSALSQTKGITLQEFAELGPRVALDLPIVEAICFKGAERPLPGQRPVYLATAGIPGAGKSTLLDQEIRAYATRAEGAIRFVKADPDTYGWKFMPNTMADLLMSPHMIARAPDFATAQIMAYTLVRPGSNIIANHILNKAMDEGYHIAHGTTMTGNSLIPGLQAMGYETRLLLCSAPSSVCAQSIQRRARDEADHHLTPEEAVSKALLAPQKFQSYFQNADQITVFWRPEAGADAVRAAVFSGGQKTVLDPEAYAAFGRQFEADRAKLAFNASQGQAVVVPPSLEVVENAYLSRFPSVLAPKPAAFTP